MKPQRAQRVSLCSQNRININTPPAPLDRGESEILSPVSREVYVVFPLYQEGIKGCVDRLQGQRHCKILFKLL